MEFTSIVHRSVRDFFAKKNLLVLDSSLMPTDEGVTVTHLRLCRICVRYLVLGEMGYSDGCKYNNPTLFSYSLLRSYFIKYREAFRLTFCLKPPTRTAAGVRRFLQEVNFETAIVRYHWRGLGMAEETMDGHAVASSPLRRQAFH